MQEQTKDQKTDKILENAKQPMRPQDYGVHELSDKAEDTGLERSLDYVFRCRAERDSIEYLLDLCDQFPISMDQIADIAECYAPVIVHCAGTNQAENGAKLLYGLYRLTEEEVLACRRENVHRSRHTRT